MKRRGRVEDGDKDLGNLPSWDIYVLSILRNVPRRRRIGVTVQTWATGSRRLQILLRAAGDGVLFVSVRCELTICDVRYTTQCLAGEGS